MAEGAAEGESLVQHLRRLAVALPEATEGGGTARKGVPRKPARQPPAARLRSRARTTTARFSVVAGKMCQEPWQEEHLGLRLSPSCCIRW